MEYKIRNPILPLCLSGILSIALLTNVSAAPVCGSSDSDPDGDGYGWENGATCLVTQTPSRTDKPKCASASSDPDGDGFGWENNASCRVAVTTPRPGPGPTNQRAICSSASSDPDGDGYGWENNTTCVVSTSGPGPSTGQDYPEEKVRLRTPECSDYRFDSDGDGFGWENSSSCTFKNYGDARSITDVILVTGQSNALGAETVRWDPEVYDADLDSPVRRVFAFSKSGWGVAGLQQIWDRDWYPRGDIASEPANNFAFHFGKRVVRKEANTVVGIIMITAPGQPIEHWHSDGDFFAQINTKVEQALASLPSGTKVRGILWHQGESDYYANDYYSNRLQKLIGDFRSQSWFASDGVFVCGETLNRPVNERLARLNTDGDSRTGCVTADGLSSVGDDIHFNAASLRTLGQRYADKFRSLAR